MRQSYDSESQVQKTLIGMKLAETIVENVFGLGGLLLVFVAIGSSVLYLNRVWGRKTPLFFSLPADYPFLRERSEKEQLSIMAGSIQSRAVRIRLLIPFGIFSLTIFSGCFASVILTKSFFRHSLCGLL